MHSHAPDLAFGLLCAFGAVEGVQVLGMQDVPEFALPISAPASTFHLVDIFEVDASFWRKVVAVASNIHDPDISWG